MKHAHKRERDYGEMELGDVLRELYARKWLIGGLTLLAGLAAAVYARGLSNVYESSAALIVREPQGTPVQDPRRPASDIPALSVEALRELAESTEVAWALFNNLWEKQALERWKQGSPDKLTAFRGLQGALMSSLKKQQTRAGGFLPILELSARAQSPADAQIIANEWANIVEAESRKVYTEDVRALDDLVGNMYKQSNEALLKLEQDLSTTTLEAGLDLKKVRLEAITEKSLELEKQIFDLEAEIAVNDVAIQGGRRRVEEQEYGGKWIGFVAEEALLAQETLPFDKAELKPLARTICGFVAQKIAQAEGLRAHREQRNLLAKQKRFEHIQEDLGRILEEKAIVDDALPAVQAEKASLSGQLEAIPEKITLEKAITDDALWSAHMNNRLADDTALVPLKSEELNPLYQSTREMAVLAEATIERLAKSAEQYARSAEASAQQIVVLQSETYLAERESDRRKQELEATEALLTTLFEAYTTEMKTIEEFTLQNAQKQAELDRRKKLRGSIAEEVAALEDDVAQHELEIQSLTREVEKTESVRSGVASKAEEIALLQVSAENAARTGTAIFYRAELNPGAVGPARRRIVLTSMLAAFVMSSFLVCTEKMIRKEES